VRSALAAAGLAILIGGCSDERPPIVVLDVSAASSLREVMQEAETAYEAANAGLDVRVNFGASGALRRQIEQGAPVDVFIAAADEPMDALVQAGLMDGRSRRSLAGNELVVIVPAGSTLAVTTLPDLVQPGIRRVAIGAPASVPAGSYAQEALRASGVARQIAAKTVLGQDVRQVLAYVASGNADAGIVYRTDAAAAGGRVRIAAAVHSTLHRPIRYPLAIAGRSSDPDRARAFAAFLLGSEGKAILRRHGFRVE
jgi:molybdate transport system substrate-binding protein